MSVSEFHSASREPPIVEGRRSRLTISGSGSLLKIHQQGLPLSQGILKTGRLQCDYRLVSHGFHPFQSFAVFLFHLAYLEASRECLVCYVTDNSLGFRNKFKKQWSHSISMEPLQQHFVVKDLGLLSVFKPNVKELAT